MATDRAPKPRPPRKIAETLATVKVIADKEPLILRIFDEIYRFLASVKLAVICISSLAFVLGAATFFEASYGVSAVRQYVYGNPAFAILLAFLGTNIFCAATIRFPWKLRQLGFVVTHIGLLVILAGAFVSLRYGDEGQLGMAEGTSSNELVRPDHSVIRVQKYEPATKQWRDSRDFPFVHGAFRWNSERLERVSKTRSYVTKLLITRGALALAVTALCVFVVIWVVKKPKALGVVNGSLAVSLLIGISAGLSVINVMTPSGPRREVITDPHDPYTIVATDYLASSGIDEMRAETDPKGYPAAKIALLAKPPGVTEAIDGMQGQEWFSADPRTFDRATHDGTPALVSFQYANGPEAAAMVDDFLHPPTKPLTEQVARVHYLDKKKTPRVYEWSWEVAENQEKKTITLPDSDISLTREGVYALPADHELTPALLGFERGPEGSAKAVQVIEAATGQDGVNFCIFTAKKPDGTTGQYGIFASLPAFSNTKAGASIEGIQKISYFTPPKLAAKGAGMGGRFAVIEVLQAEDGKLYARAFGRDGLMGTPGPIEIGKTLPLVAGARMPMQLSLRVDQVLPKASIRKVYVQRDIPREELDEAMPAVQLEMTVKNTTKKLSLLRLNDVLGSRIDWATADFPDARYRVAFDYDRSPFPFSIDLLRFEPGKDPGSPSPATFRSEVTLSDPVAGLKDKKVAIFMNNPLTYKGWSFYQSSYRRVTDPETGQKEGAYASFFQVHYDPAWKVVYGGCALVVLGIVLQFYMRAGLFSDGGKRERERAQAKERARITKARNGTRNIPDEPLAPAVAVTLEHFENL